MGTKRGVIANMGVMERISGATLADSTTTVINLATERTDTDYAVIITPTSSEVLTAAPWVSAKTKSSFTLTHTQTSDANGTFDAIVI